MARTSNDAKENIGKDKYIETKENEKVPSLKHSVSREDDKMKIKKTSIDKRIDLNTEKMKNDRISTVSEQNKIEGNMEDQSIQLLHQNSNVQNVGPVQANVKRENADSISKEPTGTEIKERSEIKEQCEKAYTFEVDDECKKPVQLGIKETTEKDIKEKTELSIINVDNKERVKKESDNSINEQKDNKKVENSQEIIKNVNQMLQGTGKISKMEVKAQTTGVNVPNNKNDSKKEKRKEASKEVTEKEQIPTIVTIKNQNETDIENNKKEESKPMPTLNQSTKNKVESTEKSFKEIKENVMEKIEFINPTEDQAKEEISENVTSNNITRGDEKQKIIKMVKKKKKKASSNNTSETIQFDELLDTSAPETNESYKVEEPESPLETFIDEQKENQRIIKNTDDKKDRIDNLLILQENPSESHAEVPSENEVHVNKAMQTPIHEIPHNKDHPIKKPNINEVVHALQI